MRIAMPRFKLRAKLFSAFVVVLMLFGAATSVVGITYVDRLVLDEGRKRIRSYLKAAWSVYNSEIRNVGQIVGLLSNSAMLREMVDSRIRSGRQAGHEESSGGLPSMANDLEALRVAWGLDYLALADSSGRIITRGRFPHATDDYTSTCCLAKADLKKKHCAGTVILPREKLFLEGRGLAEKAYTAFEDTPRAKPRPGTAETAGMAIEACSAVVSESGEILGCIYGGILLNRNYSIVDDIKKMAFGDERFAGKDIGTVTIFQWDMRIATNVKEAGGKRAIGTRVSSEVYNEVLERGGSWLDKAFVVNDWYLSAYEPIRDYKDEIIGMLYVGELMAKYDAMYRGLIYGFLMLTALGAAGGLLFSFFFSRYLTRPLARLTTAARIVGSGSFDVTIPPIRSKDEIGELNHAFQRMVTELKDRGKRLAENHENLKVVNEKLQRTNRNYLDMLGFVSHEMRSPLAVAIMAMYTLESNAEELLPENQMAILREIRKKVQYVVDISINYLNLARIERKQLASEPSKVPLIEAIIRPVVANFMEELRSRKMDVVISIAEECIVYADPNLLNIIYSNLLSNAIKYGREGGRIVLGSRREGDQYKLNVYNEGIGISPEEKTKLFKRFSRLSRTMFTKDKGTGLGLFITKAAVVLQGGTIWVDGEKDAYTNFIFTVTAAEADQVLST